MEPVDDLPLEAEPPIELQNWRNALQRVHDPDEEDRRQNNVMQEIIQQQMNERVALK